eukprot:SAG22_NODE_2338_length_2691_cov_3.150463_5_plen_114_part_00
MLHRQLVAHETELAERRNQEHTDKLEMARLKKEAGDAEFRAYAEQHGFDPDGTDWQEDLMAQPPADDPPDETKKTKKQQKKEAKEAMKKVKEEQGESMSFLNPVHALDDDTNK